MSFTGINLQTSECLCAKAVLGEHSLHSSLHRQLGLGCHQGLVLNLLQATDVAGVMVVILVLQLVAGQNSLISVDDDNEFTAVNVGGELRTVLAAQNIGSRDRSLTQRLACVESMPWRTL